MTVQHRTGRNQHAWSWMGYDRQGNQYEYCDLCRRWRMNPNPAYVPAKLVPKRYQTPESDEEV